MQRLLMSITAVGALLLVTLVLFSPQPAHAAEIRTGQTVIIPENQSNLQDLYLLGGDVQLNAPVSNDLVAAGGNINVTGDVTKLFAFVPQLQGTNKK